MKALLPVLLVLLAVGAGAFFFLVDSRSTRGEKDAHDTPPAGAPAEPGPTPAPPSGTRAPAASPSRAAKRQEAETLAAPEARAVFEGTVIAEGNPLAGASLQLLREGEVQIESQSDEQGKFRLEHPAIGSPLRLRVSARGFVALERNLTPKPTGGRTLLGNLRLPRGQRIVGRVVDGGGRGIADAELRVEPTDPGTDVLVAHGRSTPGGAFEISDAPPGTVTVVARAAGFGERSVRYTASQPQPFEILLEPGAALRLLLQTPRGVPVVDAEVTIQDVSGARGARYVQRSDEQGRAWFEGLGASAWSVRVSHPAHQPIGRGQMQTGPAEQVLECTPWPAIEGVVRAPDGAPAPSGTRVQALPASAPSERLLQNDARAVGAAQDGAADVAADGTFRIGGLRAGDWVVRVTAPGFAPARSAPVKLGIEGDGFVGPILLQAGASLAFVVTLDAAPVAAAELELLQNEPAPAQLFALQSSRGTGLGKRVATAVDGRASFDNLLPGTIWVAVYADGSPPRVSGPHVIGAGSAPIAIELERGARVRGRVATAAGKAIAGVQLRIVESAADDETESRRHLGFPLILVGDAEGRYTSGWLPAGRYTIEAFAPEDPTRHTGPTELELAAGEQRTLDFTL